MDTLSMITMMIFMVVILVVLFLLLRGLMLLYFNTIVELMTKQLNNLRSINEHFTGKQPDGSEKG